MGNDCAIRLHKLSGKYGVDFNEQKMEVCGNLDGLVKLREDLNKAAKKQRFELSSFNEERISNSNLGDFPADRKDLNAECLQEASPPVAFPRTMKNGEKLRLQALVNGNVLCPELDRHAPALPSGETKSEKLDSSSMNSRLTNDKLQDVQVNPGKQQILCNINKQYSATVDIYTDVYAYISATFASEIDQIKRKHDVKVSCSPTERRSVVKIEIIASSGTDLDEGVSKFHKLIAKVSVHQYVLQKEHASFLDIVLLNSKIQSGNKRKKDVEIIFNDEQKSWKMIGNMNDAKTTENWIGKFVESEIGTRREANSARGVVHVNTSDTCNGVYMQPLDFQNPVSWNPSNSASFTSRATVFSIVSSDSINGNLLFTTGPNHSITVRLECKDMLRPFCERKLPDAIVSPCDKNLKCEVGLSRAILDAAGHSVRSSCTERAGRGEITVTDYFLTDGGKLNVLGLKHIIHAVGPDPRLCNNNMKQIQKMTTETYYNCLMRANSIQISSLALPLLGVGKHYGVGLLLLLVISQRYKSITSKKLSKFNNVLKVDISS